MQQNFSQILKVQIIFVHTHARTHIRIMILLSARCLSRNNRRTVRRILTTRVTHMLSRSRGLEKSGRPTIESEINEVNEVVLGRTEETLTNSAHIHTLHTRTHGKTLDRLLAGRYTPALFCFSPTGSAIVLPRGSHRD